MVDVDDCVNYWGCKYVTMERTNPVGTFHELDMNVRSTIKGFHLRELYRCGTDANAKAMDEVTNGDRRRCLIGLGSYVGGDGGPMQFLSTSGFHLSNPTLCYPTPPNKSEDCARDQTIPLPYYVDSNLNNKADLTDLENKCLDVIQLRIVGAKFSGTPFLGLLMETMLSGCGGELSHNFYKKLAAILKKNNIKVIMDEIMTGGRIGPGFASSLALPAEFISQIRFITMGKFFDCGLLLEAVTNQPTIHRVPIQGFSTTLDTGIAKAVWTQVSKKI